MMEEYKGARMCPKCGADSRVYDSREQEDGRIVRHRRCLDCDTKFKTVEVFAGYVSKTKKRRPY